MQIKNSENMFLPILFDIVIGLILRSRLFLFIVLGRVIGRVPIASSVFDEMQNLNVCELLDACVEQNRETVLSI